MEIGERHPVHRYATAPARASCRPFRSAACSRKQGTIATRTAQARLDVQQRCRQPPLLRAAVVPPATFPVRWHAVYTFYKNVRCEM